MAETPSAGRNAGGQGRHGAAVTDDAVSAWFVREIMPLEPVLMRYLQHNWRNSSEIADLRQEIYARVFEAARERIPDQPKHFLLSCARNLLIDLVRRGQVVPIEAIADLDALGVAADAPEPDRAALARGELDRVKNALARLPARAREAVVLAYFEGLSGMEVAARMGVTKSTASKHLANGLRILSDLLHETDTEGSARP